MGNYSEDDPLLIRAIKRFGRTDNPYRGAWILPDGKYLSKFKGGSQIADHSAILDIMNPSEIMGEGTIPSVRKFECDTGSVRYYSSPNGQLYLEWCASNPPNAVQTSKIRELGKDAEQLELDVIGGNLGIIFTEQAGAIDHPIRPVIERALRVANR